MGSFSDTDSLYSILAIPYLAFKVIGACFKIYPQRIYIMIKNLFVFILGSFSGLWIAWPGITIRSNWSCAKEIIVKSYDNEIDIRTLMSVKPKYLIRKEKYGEFDKLRIVGDICFRKI